jgi:hypothetical protein
MMGPCRIHVEKNGKVRGAKGLYEIALMNGRGNVYTTSKASSGIPGPRT